MKKYTCFALLAFFGAAALTPTMAAGDASAPAAPHHGDKKDLIKDHKDNKGHDQKGHDHKDHKGHDHKGK